MFILDVETLLSLDVYARDDVHRTAIKGALLDAIEIGSVNFPDQVLKECQRLAAGDHVIWLRAASAHRNQIDIPYQRVMQVLGTCSEAIDPDVEDEPSQLYVVAMAFEVQATGTEPTVVTDEVNALPDRMPLASVCRVGGISCCSAKQFFESIDPTAGEGGGIIRP